MSAMCLLVVWLQNQLTHDLPGMSKPPYTTSGANRSKNVDAYSGQIDQQTHTHTQTPRLYTEGQKKRRL